jgi:hypothetical protein
MLEDEDALLDMTNRDDIVLDSEPAERRMQEGESAE